jgi:hypothetical protein
MTSDAIKIYQDMHYDDEYQHHMDDELADYVRVRDSLLQASTQVPRVHASVHYFATRLPPIRSSRTVYTGHTPAPVTTTASPFDVFAGSRLNAPFVTAATATTTTQPPPRSNTHLPRVTVGMFPLYGTSEQHTSSTGLMSILANAFSSFGQFDDMTAPNPGVSLFDPFDVSTDNIMGTLFSQFTDQPVEHAPIPSSMFDSFPKMKYEKLGDYMESIAPEKRITVDTECTICKSDYEPNSTVVVLPECQHHFDEKCIKKWLTEMHYKCPTCRHSYSPNSEAN